MNQSLDETGSHEAKFIVGRVLPRMRELSWQFRACKARRREETRGGRHIPLEIL